MGKAGKDLRHVAEAKKPNAVISIHVIFGAQLPNHLLLTVGVILTRGF